MWAYSRMGKILYYIRCVVVVVFVAFVAFVALSECKNKKEENFTTGSLQHCCNKYLSATIMCNSNVASTSSGDWELFLLWLIFKRRGNLNCERLIMRIVINMSEICWTILLKLTGFFLHYHWCIVMIEIYKFFRVKNNKISMPSFKNYSLLKITNPVKKQPLFASNALPIHLMKITHIVVTMIHFSKMNVDHIK